MADVELPQCIEQSGQDGYVTPEGEHWKVIGYPGLSKKLVSPKSYKYVSSWGNLMSLDGKMFEYHPLCTYQATNLRLDKEGSVGTWETAPVHIIVAYTFLGPKPNTNWTVDHVDRDRHNNCVSNLRWVSPNDQLDNREYAQYQLSMEDGQTFDSIVSASDKLDIKLYALYNTIRPMLCRRLVANAIVRMNS